MSDKTTTILIVDDEEDILEFIKYNLEKEGFHVYTAKNGLEGIKVAESVVPNLILLDVMMPEMDGIEVCRTLRADEKFNNTIISFLSARNEDYTQIAGLDVGGDDYITKPIRPRLLISRIKALLRRASKSENLPAEELVFGDLKINKEQVAVIVREKQIPFAKKEFALLYLLASKPGKVFPRQEIYHKVWGTDVIVGDRTIDVHIRKLREKIGSDYIKTIKGIGYKFEPLS